MKRLFSLLVLALSFSAIFAQQTTVALLNHEGTLTSFYGTNALVDAHKAAVNGDIITLSGGSFAPVEFTKGLTVRGAGIITDSTGTREITTINAEVVMNLSTKASIEFTDIFFSNGITYKGGNYNIENSTFNRCKIHNKMTSVTGIVNIYNCFIDNIEASGKSTSITTINIINSVVSGLNAGYQKYNKFNVTNSIIIYYIFNGSPRTPNYTENTTFKNCIFTGVITEDKAINYCYLPETTSANNCISCFYAYTPETESEAAIYYSNIFQNIANPNSTNINFSNANEVFKLYNGTTRVTDISIHETFELTDAAKAILGTDGTEVGVHGGIGFNLAPTTLQITKCEVAPKATKEGKLSVSIEVGISE